MRIDNKKRKTVLILILVAVVTLSAVLILNLNSLQKEDKNFSSSDSEASSTSANIKFEFGRSESLPSLGIRPDAPARAFIDQEGYVILSAPHDLYKLYRGTNLKRLIPDSTDRYMSEKNSNPRMYADREWLVSPYTENGKDIFAIIHNEYHGWEHHNCNTGTWNCWWNSITLARSNDGGMSYQKVAHPPEHAILSPTINYDPWNENGPIGPMEPTNIIKKDGLYYMSIGQTGYPTGRNGRCIVRTSDLSKATGWESYNPETGGFDQIPNNSIFECKPLHPGPPGYSWYYSNYLEKYVGLLVHWDIGAYYALSDDLLSWTEPVRIAGTETACIYGSFIQPGSDSRNFETIERSPWLYYSSDHNGCVPGQAHVLNRRRIRMSKPGEENTYELLDLRFNEKAGSDALDSSFYGSDAVLHGSYEFRSGGDKNYIRFSEQAYGSVSHKSNLNISSDFTIETRIRTSQNLQSGQYTTLISKEQGACANRAYGLYLSPTGKLHFSYSKAGGGCVGSESSSVVNDGQWHNISIVYDSSEKKVSYYIDGNLDNSSTFDAQLGQNDNTANLIIGSGYDGDMEHMRIFNYQKIPTSSSPVPPADPTPDPTQPDPTPANIDIDLNEDGEINMQDYHVFITDYLKFKREGILNQRSDITRDDAINMSDYHAFIVEYLKIKRQKN